MMPIVTGITYHSTTTTPLKYCNCKTGTCLKCNPYFYQSEPCSVCLRAKILCLSQIKLNSQIRLCFCILLLLLSILRHLNSQIRLCFRMLLFLLLITMTLLLQRPGLLENSYQHRDLDKQPSQVLTLKPDSV